MFTRMVLVVALVAQSAGGWAEWCCAMTPCGLIDELSCCCTAPKPVEAHGCCVMDEPQPMGRACLCAQSQTPPTPAPASQQGGSAGERLLPAAQIAPALDHPAVANPAEGWLVERAQPAGSAIRVQSLLCRWQT